MPPVVWVSLDLPQGLPTLSPGAVATGIVENAPGEPSPLQQLSVKVN